MLKIGTRISPDWLDRHFAKVFLGQEGAIDYDHIMGISTDTPVGREYIAFCVGHARGMLQGLANS